MTAAPLEKPRRHLSDGLRRRSTGYLASTVIMATGLGIGLSVSPRVTGAAAGALLSLSVLASRPRLFLYLTPVLVALPSNGPWGSALGQYRTRLTFLLLGGLVAVLASPQAPGKRKLGVGIPLVGVSVVIVLHLLLQAFPADLTTRALEMAVALSLATTAYRQTMSDRRPAVVAARVITVYMLIEVAIGAAQFAMHDPLFMASSLSPAAIEEATNIPGLFRALGTYSHANSLGLSLTLALPFALRMRKDPEQRWRSISLPAVLLILLGVAFSLSRGALLVSTGILLLNVFLQPHRTKSATAMVGVLSVIAVSVLTITPVTQAFERFTSSSVASRDMGSAAARTANMGAAWSGFLRSPLVGHGFGSSAIEGNEYGGYTGLGAHDAYLDVLQGGGIVLFGCACLLGLALAPRVSAARRALDPLWLLPPAVLAYAFVESVIQASFVMIIALSLGVLLTYPLNSGTGVGNASSPRLALS